MIRGYAVVQNFPVLMLLKTERVEAIAQRFKAQHEAAIRQMHEEKERRERRALARSTSLNLNQIRASIISPYVKSKQEVRYSSLAIV